MKVTIPPIGTGILRTRFHSGMAFRMAESVRFLTARIARNSCKNCFWRWDGLYKKPERFYSPKSAATFLSMSRMGRLYGQRLSHWPQPMQALAFTLRVSYRSLAQPASP